MRPDGRVALQQIQTFTNFAREGNRQKSRNFQILAVSVLVMFSTKTC